MKVIDDPNNEEELIYSHTDSISILQNYTKKLEKKTLKTIKLSNISSYTTEEFFTLLKSLELQINLETLSINRTHQNTPNPLSSIIKIIPKLPSLITLDFTNCDFDDLILLELIEKIKENQLIKNLNLINCELTFGSGKILSDFLINSKHKLFQLDISENSLLKVTGAEYIFKALNSNSTLKRLSISHVYLEYAVDLISKMLKENQTLQNLSLNVCNLDQSHLFKIMTSLKENKTLEILNLSQNRKYFMDYKSFDFCSILKMNKTLKELNISSTSIDDDVFESICKGLKLNKSIEKFNISSCSKLIVPHIIFQYLRENTTLKELDFSGNRIMDDRIKYVAESLNINNRLVHLNLINSITKRGSVILLKNLSNNKKLKILRFTSELSTQSYLSIDMFWIKNRSFEKLDIHLSKDDKIKKEIILVENRNCNKIKENFQNMDNIQKKYKMIDISFDFRYLSHKRNNNIF